MHQGISVGHKAPTGERENGKSDEVYNLTLPASFRIFIAVAHSDNVYLSIDLTINAAAADDSVARAAECRGQGSFDSHKVPV
jgi:hypothetical protein